MKRKKKRNSQAMAPVASGAGKNGTLAPCSKRPRRTVDDKFVCKEWNAIISDPLFIRAHLVQSVSSPASTGFLIQDDDLDDAKLKQAFYVHPYDRVVGILELPFQATVLSSCNGLLLLQNAIFPEQLSVVNLATKANLITLLPLSLTLPKVLTCHRPSAVLAFAPSSGRYKVLYACLVAKYPPAKYPSLEELDDHLLRFEVKIMVWTIGVDETWRAIDIENQGISMTSWEAKTTLMHHPFSIAGGSYICWFTTNHYLGFALDIDAETMGYQFAGPEDVLTYFRHGLRYCIPLLDTGGAALIYLKNPTKFWKVWELIGPKTGGPWGTCMNFDAAGLRSALHRHFHPLIFGGSIPLHMSLKTGEFWFFGYVINNYCFRIALVCYNWKTGSIWSSPLRWREYFYFPHLHVNSLLSLKDL